MCAPQALRRLRLPLFFDSALWVVPAGALTHLLITLPYWTRRVCGAPGRVSLALPAPPVLILGVARVGLLLA